MTPKAWWARQSDFETPWLVLWVFALLVLLAAGPVMLGWVG